MHRFIKIIQGVGTVALVVAVTVGYGTAGVAAASDSIPGRCGSCTDLGGTGHWHRARANWLPSSGVSEGHGWHRAMAMGNCALEHGVCVFASNGDDQADQLTEAIVDAVAVADVRRLVGLVTASGVYLSDSRSAIQVVGCDGETIVGHVPVRDHLLTAVETAASDLLGSEL